MAILQNDFILCRIKHQEYRQRRLVEIVTRKKHYFFPRVDTFSLLFFPRQNTYIS